MRCGLWLWTFLLLALPCLVWAADSTDKPTEEPVTSSPSPASEEADVRVELIARQFTTLSAEIAARIVKLPFREGDWFAKGDLLVELYCGIQLAKLNRAKAVLSAESAKAKVLGRLDQLNVTSKMEIVTAKAEEEKAQAEMVIIQTEIEGCRISAPFAGQLVTLPVREHQYVKSGEALVEILDPRVLELAFNMPSRWLQRLHKQDRLLVRIDETGKSYPARILTFGARIDAISQHVKVTGEIIGQFPELSPGMSGRILSGMRQQPAAKP
ncbi:MAG: hypothetical protein HW380_142 [Magnetococcales bacterium]|nr:hypothetical protein [Magnetococcales bacterium]